MTKLTASSNPPVMYEGCGIWDSDSSECFIVDFITVDIYHRFAKLSTWDATVAEAKHWIDEHRDAA